MKEIPGKKLAEQTETRVCSDCKTAKSIEEFKGANDSSISYNGYFINCMLCRMQQYRKPRSDSSFPKNIVVTSKQSKSQITNDHKQKKDDKEIKNINDSSNKNRPFSNCLRCGRDLEDTASANRGYGPICWAKKNSYY